MNYTGNKQVLNDGTIQYKYNIGFCAGYKPMHQDIEVLIRTNNGLVKTFDNAKQALKNAKKFELKSIGGGSPFTRPFYYWSDKKPI